MYWKNKNFCLWLSTMNKVINEELMGMKAFIIGGAEILGVAVCLTIGFNNQS